MTYIVRTDIKTTKTASLYPVQDERERMQGPRYCHRINYGHTTSHIRQKLGRSSAGMDRNGNKVMMVMGWDGEYCTRKKQPYPTLQVESNNDTRKEMGSIKHTKGMDGMEQQWQTGGHKGNNGIKQCRVKENVF